MEESYMKELRVSLVQMSVDTGKPQINRDKAVKMIQKAAEAKPDVVILPEMWNTGYSFNNLESICDREGNPTLEIIKELARKNYTNIVAGSIADLRDNKVFNTSYIVDRNGEKVFQYSKVHLFRLMEEDRYLTAGDALGLFQLENAWYGVMICYDLRFPELMRSLALKGAKAVFVPAQWPYPRQEHWVTLLRARAIENQLYVIATNRVGKGGDNRFFGSSMVVDPWGEVVVQAGDEEGVVNAKIDLGLVDSVREKIPVFEDRREEIYRGQC
jgi:predicted amidohydrolase